MSFSRSEQDMFQAAVTQAFGDLAVHGAVIGNLQEKTNKLTGNQLVIEVEFPSTGRGLSVALLRSPDRTREALTTFLHKDGTGGFMVHAFLKTKGLPSEMLHLSAHTGTLANRVGTVLKETRATVDRHLLQPLMGGGWPIVPVDWAGYR